MCVYRLKRVKSKKKIYIKIKRIILDAKYRSEKQFHRDLVSYKLKIYIILSLNKNI